ncbi:MAG TPA: VWA domain-containing protein [Vicinamibacterales bacterium]|nr:VWA domain-containing protein [Vicinamibacterales bacterium]
MTRTNRFLTSVALMVSAVLTAAQEPQAPPAQPPITFRAEVNYVEVDARVLDAQGSFVTGLTGTDFQVFEDGKPQQVSAFSLVNLPVERQQRPLFASAPIEPDVQNNLTGYDGRIYVLVLDDQHTHPLRSARTKAAAKQFIQRYMGANDTAAVVFTSGRSDAAQEFTNSQGRLLASVDKFTGRKLRSSTLERIDEEDRTRGTRQQGDRIDDMLDNERGLTARTTLESIRNLANYLGGISGRRKAIVYFSEGIDYDITDVFNNRSASSVMDATRDAINAATRGNVAIYGIDPRGLGAGSDDLIEVGSLPQDNSINLGASSFLNEARLGQDSLRVLSEETGGFAIVNQNDLAANFERVVADNSAYYLLGYYSTNERRDGKFRKIEVRVARPGLTVRARKGYAAARGKAEPDKGDSKIAPELRAALASPLPASGLPLALSAAVFKGADRKGAVAVSTLVGARDLPLTEKDGTFRNDLEVVLTAADYGGKSYPGDRATLTLNLKPDSVTRLRAGGFRILNQIDLPPGRYQLRVAVLERNTSRAGSVTDDLDVPDFTKEKLSISGLALTSALSGLTLTARPKDPLAKMLPGPMTTYREFTAGDELALFVEVYDNSGSQPHKVDIDVSLRSEGGRSVFQAREEHDSSELAGGPGGYGFSARVPLKDVPPGLYVLRVTGKTRVGDQAEATRETIVRVLAPPVP